MLRMKNLERLAKIILVIYHLVISHGWPGREKDVCIMSSQNLSLLKADYKIAKSMKQNPRIYKTEMLPPLLDKLHNYEQVVLTV